MKDSREALFRRLNVVVYRSPHPQLRGEPKRWDNFSRAVWLQLPTILFFSELLQRLFF